MSKKYLIIGGSSGIGKAIVNKLHEQGHQVFASYNKNEQHTAANGPSYFHLDVTADLSGLGQIEGPIDGLVYSPGTINLKPFSRISPEQFTLDFDLQVTGAIKVIQTMLPQLKAAESASIVLFSTVAVQNGFNFHSQVAASKGAIEGLTRSLAAEFAPKIRVNAIAPSLTDTPLASKLLSTEEKRKANAQRHPLKRIGQPENIAEMASFLLTEKSAWITGQILGVDGGMSSIKS
jgi:NAD(P)-dependent dehydrogenase (short-subunit alcohol dehydrogenase family)